MSKFDQILQRD